MKFIPVFGVIALLTACASAVVEINTKPVFVGSVSSQSYDGAADDLLTAGLGKTGLASAVAPVYADPLKPTAAELRRVAIYTNYRAMLDMTAAGGYGRYYGPNVAADGTVGSGEGMIAGQEFFTYSDDGTGAQNVSLMVQVPATFNANAPCIITATSSGSRSIYGAISTGEWGLKRGCAVAYTDKGTHSAGHDLMSDTVPLIDGTRSTSAVAGSNAAFRAGLSAAEQAAFNAASPNRLAFKHAHSGRNPEKDWGKYTLQAVEFAYYVLNEKFGDALFDGSHARRYKAGDILVIASSISNGAGAALAAAEQDGQGWISGVAVSEPGIVLPANTGVSIQRGANTVAVSGKTLFDFTSYANLYQSCASQAASLGAAPGKAYVVAPWAVNRCASLKAKGLLSADTPASQADEALKKMHEYGWEADADLLHASHAAFEVAPAVTVTFASALARARVSDRLCGYSYAAATSAGSPMVMDAKALAGMFATGNGVPPSSGVQLINDLNPGAPLRDLLSFSPSSLKQDFNLDGALCLRNLLTGVDVTAKSLQLGLDETRRTANLRGKPALIVHGRNDALLPVNHTSRPYTAMNKVVEGDKSRLSYIEVDNAQHFDGFIGLPTVLPGYDTRFVPLHVYLNRAMDAMYEHLKNGKALPASQVVRTSPRGGTPGAAPALTDAHLPAIATTPAAADAIVMNGTTLKVPD